MGRLGDTTVDALLDLMFGSGHVAPFPASYDVGLSTTLPANDGTGITEPVGGSYARVVVPNDDAHFPPAAGRQQSIDTLLEFPAPTGPWSTALVPIRCIVLWDHAGTYRASFALKFAMVIDATSAPPVIPAGTFVIYGPGS
jgi:hypothetical protein